MMVAGLLVTSSIRAKEFLVGQCIPPETRFLLRIDVKAVYKSSFGQPLLDVIKAKHGMDFQEWLDKQVGVKLNKIDQVWIMGFPRDNTLLVFKGSFSTTSLKYHFGKQPGVQKERRKGWRFFAGWVDHNKMMAGGLLDTHTLILGPRQLVERYENYILKKAQPLAPTHPLLKKLNTNIDPVVGTLFQPKQPNTIQDPFLRKVKEAWFAVTFVEDQLTATISFEFFSSEEAEKTQRFLHGLKHLAQNANPQPKRPVKQDFITHLLLQGELIRQENMLIITMDMDTAGFKKFLLNAP